MKSSHAVSSPVAASTADPDGLVRILGVEVLPRSLEELLAVVEQNVRRQRKVVIPHHNLHSAALMRRDVSFREFFQRYPGAHIDGMSLVIWGKVLGLPLRREHRVTYLDLIGPLMQMAAENRWRVFHLGGRPDVAQRAAQRVQRDFGVEIEVHHGYLDDCSGDEIIRLICDYKPDLALIGMGMPRQERWLLENIPVLPDAIYLCSGGCFDYLAGEQGTPPRWAGRLGLEWIFRLVGDPRRLGRRYLIEPFQLLPVALSELQRAFKRGPRSRE